MATVKGRWPYLCVTVAALATAASPSPAADPAGPADRLREIPTPEPPPGLADTDLNEGAGPAGLASPFPAPTDRPAGLPLGLLGTEGVGSPPLHGPGNSRHRERAPAGSEEGSPALPLPFMLPDSITGPRGPFRETPGPGAIPEVLCAQICHAAGATVLLHGSLGHHINEAGQQDLLQGTARFTTGAQGTTLALQHLLDCDFVHEGFIDDETDPNFPDPAECPICMMPITVGGRRSS